MPKSKKKRSDDFKKVKLKVGKKLKKPTETNTSFRATKVVLLEQLKSGAAGNSAAPLTRKNQTLTDLLRHLRHYNVNMRKDGVNGLKEVLGGNPALIRLNLGALVENLAPLLADVETDVLKATSDLWELIISTIDATILTPHLPLLIAHLKCALTHLNANVKRSSLKLFDLLLSSHVELLRAPAALDLVRCFLDSVLKPQMSTVGRGSTSRLLMTKAEKDELLKVAKKILPLLERQESSFNAERIDGLRPSPVVDCSSSSFVVSVSLSAAEWSHGDFSNYDDYVRPLGSGSNELSQLLTHFKTVIINF